MPAGDVVSTYGIEGFGETYAHSSGELKRIVYLYDEDYSGELQVSSVPENEVTAEVMSNPEGYILVTIMEGAKKILKILSRSAGISIREN